MVVFIVFKIKSLIVKVLKRISDLRKVQDITQVDIMDERVKRERGLSINQASINTMITNHQNNPSTVQMIESPAKGKGQKRNTVEKYSANERSSSAVRINEDYWMNYRVGQFRVYKNE